MSELTNNLIRNLRYLMTARGLNANSLSEKMKGKPPQATIFRILNGESATPRDATIQPLADFFGVEVHRLRYDDLTTGTSLAAPKAVRPDKSAASVSERINIVMSETSAHIDEIAKAAKVDTEVVISWIKGLSEIKLEEAVGIQEKFGYSVLWIVKGLGSKKVPGIYNEDPFNPIPFPKGRRIPVVGMAQLGDNGHWADVEYPVGHGDGYLDFPSRDKNAYGIKCQGDSMMPRIKDGEFVVIEPNHPVENGDEVLVKATDGRVMIKILLYQRMGRTHLMSVNSEHQPIAIATDKIEKMHYVAAIVKQSMWRHE